MSASEFTEWKAMFTVEELHPSADQLRHAQLLAALHNGALTRKGKKLFTASEFLKPDTWAMAAPAPQATSLASQVDALNSRLDP